MNPFKKKQQQQEDGTSILVTIFDLATQEHGPLMTVANLNVARRAAQGHLQRITVPSTEFLLCIHGELNKKGIYKAIQPFLEPLWYQIEPEVMLSNDAVNLMVQEWLKKGELKNA